MVEIKTYPKPAKLGLSKIVIANLYENLEFASVRNSELAWLLLKNNDGNKIPDCNRFHEKIYQDNPYEKSLILYLPFVQEAATNLITIYTSILKAREMLKKRSKKWRFLLMMPPCFGRRQLS